MSHDHHAPAAPAFVPPTAAERDEALKSRQKTYEEILSKYGVKPDPDNGGPLVPREKHFELAKTLKTAGWTFYVTVVASHYLATKSKKGDDPEHFEVASVLRAPGLGSHAAQWRVRLEVGQDIDSLVPLFEGADWQEREQYDLVGVKFTGHPDLRRIMMPEEWDSHPLRKDFAINTRSAPWR